MINNFFSRNNSSYGYGNKSFDYLDSANLVQRQTVPRINNLDSFGMSYAPGYGPKGVTNLAPKAVYNADPARNKVNEALATMEDLKNRNANKTAFDPMSVIPDSATKKKRKRDDDDDDEDEGPTLAERYLRDIQKIQSGNFAYSATEKANLDNIRRTGRDMELRQSRVNDNYQGGTLQGELRTGRSRYAQELADDAMVNALQFGTERINDIDLQTSKGVAELESAIKEQRLRDIATQYGFLQKQDQMRIDETANIQEALIEAQKAQALIDNYGRTNEIRNAEYAMENDFFEPFLNRESERKKAEKYAPNYSNNDGGWIFGNIADIPVKDE